MGDSLCSQPPPNGGLKETCTFMCISKAMFAKLCACFSRKEPYAKDVLPDTPRAYKMQSITSPFISHAGLTAAELAPRNLIPLHSRGFSEGGVELYRTDGPEHTMTGAVYDSDSDYELNRPYGKRPRCHDSQSLMLNDGQPTLTRLYTNKPEDAPPVLAAPSKGIANSKAPNVEP